jgi:prefoldin subunit 5
MPVRGVILCLCALLLSPGLALGQTSSPRGGWTCPCPGGHRPMGNASSCNEVCFGRQSLPVSEFPQHTAAYAAIVARLSAQVSNERIAPFRNKPSSEEALSSQLDRLGQAIRAWLDDAWESLDYNADMLPRYRRQMNEIPAQLAAGAQELAKSRADRPVVDARIAQLKPEADRLERNVAALARVADQLSMQTDQTKREIVRQLHLISPAEDKVIGKDMLSPSVRLLSYPVARTFNPIYAEATAVPTATARAVRRYPHPLPPVAGGTTEKIAAVTKLADTLEAIGRQRDPVVAEVRLLQPQVEELRRKRDALGRELVTVQKPLREAVALESHLRHAIYNSEERMTAMRDNVVIRSVETYAWRMVKRYVVEPEFRQYLFESGLTSIDTVRRWIEREESPPLPVIQRMKWTKRYLDVQRRVLQLLQDSERFLVEAPQIAALGTPEETAGFLGELDALTRTAGADLLSRTGTGRGLLALPARTLGESRIPDSIRNSAFVRRLVELGAK